MEKRAPTEVMGAPGWNFLGAEGALHTGLERSGGHHRLWAMPGFAAGLHFLLQNQKAMWLLLEPRIQRSQWSGV